MRPYRQHWPWTLVTVLALVLTSCSGASVKNPPRWPIGPDYAYVTTPTGIVPINLVSHTLGRPFVGDYLGLSDLSIAPGGHTAYASSTEGFVALNLANGVVKPFSHTRHWAFMAMAPDGRTIFLTGYISGTGPITEHSFDSGPKGDEILPVNTLTGAIGTAFKVPCDPTGMEIAPGGQLAYAATAAGDDIQSINLATRVCGPLIAVPSGASDPAYSSDGTTAYTLGTMAVGKTGIDLTPINVASGVPGKPIAIGIQPHEIVISSNGRTAYATDGYGVRVIDLATGKVTLTIRMDVAGGGPGGGPGNIALG
jgi:DNA-binding beta-propeller fold protein YncE